MYQTHSVYLIAAADQKNGIGKDGRLPWRLPSEMAFFARITTEAPEGHQNLVVMGSRTWESIPPKRRPLLGRLNAVLSRRPEFFAEGAQVVSSLDAALFLADTDETIATIFVIGGTQVYAEAMTHPATDGVYLTRVNSTFDCDTFLPPMPEVFSEVTSLGTGQDGDVTFEYLLYKRPQ